MLRILVVGDVDADPELVQDVRTFAERVGAAVVRQKHLLLNSCRNELDRIVAGEAENQLNGEGGDPKQRIISYVMEGQDPVHRFGTVRQSRLHDWELGSPGLMTPEPVELADAVIVIGGAHGTHRAANWARIANKPLLPVTRFAGAGREIYYQELDRFANTYASRVERSEYESLSDMSSDPDALANIVVSLAERITSSSSVFVVMSFSENPELEDVYGTFKAACVDEKYSCSRVDEDSNVPRILPEILSRIYGCAFVIVDLTDEKLNVYYELGYAEALGKPLIVTAKEGTQLPFDVKDIPVIFWKNQTGLRDQLTKRIREIAETQGR